MQEGYDKYLKAGKPEEQGKYQDFIRGLTLASQRVSTSMPGLKREEVNLESPRVLSGISKF